MAKIDRTVDETAYARVGDAYIPPIGGLMITKLVREHIPLMKPRSGFGETIGQVIDKTLADAASDRTEIHEITLMFEPEQWQEMATTLRGEVRPAR